MNAKLNITCDVIEFEALYKYEREAKYYMIRNQGRKRTLNTSTDWKENRILEKRNKPKAAQSTGRF